MKVRVIIPCYNESKRIDLYSFAKFLDQNSNNSIHLLFVNDGSSDNTLQLLSQLKENHKTVDVLNLTNNAGKAEAIRKGVTCSLKESYSYIGYLDADLATPLEELNRLVQLVRDKQPYIVLGTRVKILGATDIKRNKWRHYIGRAFATVVSNMLKLPIYDTQCGAKLIKTEVAEVIFKDSFVSKWLFDVELLFRIKNNFHPLEGKIIEMPLTKWEDIAGSKISGSYFFKAPLDLLRIYVKYR